MLRRSEAVKKRLLIDGFDELNVIKAVDGLYAELDADARERYAELYFMRYAEVLRENGKKPPKREDGELLADLYLTGLLSEPDPVTHYAWDAEVLRKRDRAKEAVNAVPNKALKQIELDKAIRLWSRQTQQYADTVSDGAALNAMKKAGVKRVRWITQGDGKVCSVCRGLNGKVFDIDNVPPKDHPRCRCTLAAVK